MNEHTVIMEVTFKVTDAVDRDDAEASAHAAVERLYDVVTLDDGVQVECTGKYVIA